MLWVKELFSDYKQTAGLSDYGENGPAALPSEIFRNILGLYVGNVQLQHTRVPQELWLEYWDTVSMNNTGIS